MQQNYKRLGDFIREVKVKNRDGSLSVPLGINIDKFFMPSVANIIGTDLTNYKIVRRGQFACNRMHVGRDERIPVALSDKDDFIVSPAYDVFEIINEELLPEYLMMWFKRKEFDRNAWFYTDGDVRGGLKWNDFCEIPVNIPPIKTQREMVAEYEAVERRIRLNNALCQKLEDAAQALYRHWFEDFEFPTPLSFGEGPGVRPYKSSGGKMVMNEELGKEIPEGWRVGKFTDSIKISGGGTPKTENDNYWDGEILFFTPKDCSQSVYTIQTEKTLTVEGLKNCSSKLYSKNTTFVTARGTVGKLALAGEDMAMNQSCYALLPNDVKSFFFTYHLSKKVIDIIKDQVVGAVFSALITSDFNNVSVIIPDEKTIDKFETEVTIIFNNLFLKQKQTQKLEELKTLLLGKMVVAE